MLWATPKLRPCLELRRPALANQTWAWRGNKTTSYFDFLLGGRGSLVIPQSDRRSYSIRLTGTTIPPGQDIELIHCISVSTVPNRPSSSFNKQRTAVSRLSNSETHNPAHVIPSAEPHLTLSGRKKTSPLLQQRA